MTITMKYQINTMNYDKREFLSERVERVAKDVEDNRTRNK